MRRFLFLLFIVLFLHSGLVNAQRDSSRNDFTNAESWFLFEEYADAESLYQKLLKWDPDNDNLKYKIGICLLNDPYQKQEAIDYLLEASKNINPGYKDGSFKEKTAPPDVLFYLGSAYLVNDKIDLAIESFQGFLKIMDSEVYDRELVQAQIKACENAKRLMSMPVDLDLQPMGSSVNTHYSETNPVISGNGERMAFITKQPFFDEALYIEKVKGEWTLPMSVTSMLGFDMDIYPVALNYEGTEMLLYYDDEHIGNLYTSRYEDGFWTGAVKLDENISTKYWESHACFSKDGQTLYFTSNRKGTLGGLDIYKSERNAEGKWGLPENLGSEINTRYNEETPFITEDGNTLYFSSYGHYNMGGYDIFYSTKNDDGSWGKPVNLGYPINSTDDDLFFHPVDNGLGGYQSRISETKANKQDIYYMDIYSANNPRMYVVTGFVHTMDGDTDLTTLEMFVIDPENGDTIKYSIPIQEDGSFSMTLTRGDYNLHLCGEGFQELITPLSITPISNKEKVVLKETMELTPLKKEALVFEGEESAIELKELTYEGTVGMPLIIPVKAKKGSSLIMKTYQDSMLVSTDTIEMDKKRADLEIMPLQGTSVVELEMTDKEGNIHRNSLTITGKQPVKMPKDSMPTVPEEVAEASLATALAPAAILLSNLQQDEQSPLHATLLETEIQEEGIESPRELFEHLYLQADQGDYSKEDVDLALALTIAGEDAELLLKQLQENSDGPMKAYLDKLNLDKEGIHTPEELLKYLELVAEDQNFTMDEVRKSMLKSVESYAGATPDISDDPIDGMKVILLRNSTGALHELLDTLDTRQEKIGSSGELFDYLYQQADEVGYNKAEVDQLLMETLAKGDSNRLYQLLLENSEGALFSYLEKLDLEKEGINSPEDLLRHLGKVAGANGFSMDDVRWAMTAAMDHPLEVERQYKNLLARSDGAMKEILKEINLKRDGIYTLDQLIETTYKALTKRGFSNKEIADMLIDLFPDHEKLIAELTGKDSNGRFPVILGVGLGSVILLFILFFARRRKREE